VSETLRKMSPKGILDFFSCARDCASRSGPYAKEDAYLRPHVEAGVMYPFAFLVSDLSTAVGRLRKIEQALNLPGEGGWRTLL